MTAPAAAEAIAAWRADPVLYVRQVIGVEPDRWQARVLRAVPKNLRIALKACKGPGKSTLLAWIIWWWLAVKPHPKVVATSISGDNLADGLWAELAKWRSGSALLKAAFEWTSSRIYLRESPDTWFASARTWPKDSDSARQAETLAGVHADHVLFVVDEVGGVPDAVIAAAEAGLANVSEAEGRTALLLIAGNPTTTSGPLWRACTRDRAAWWVYEVTGDPDDPERSPRISVEWARQQIRHYGADHPWVLVNVFGRFPPSSANVLLGPDEVAEAMRRQAHDSVLAGQPLVWGLDVARYGDDESVLFQRQGVIAWRPRLWRNVSTMDLADAVAEMVGRRKPDAVFVDSGTFGAAVVDRLLQLGCTQVVGVDFGGRPLGDRALNRRSEMWLSMADWVRRGCLPNDAQLTADLTTPLYSMDKHSKLALEPKDKIKLRLGRSPDRGDALALTFAAPVLPRDLLAGQGGPPRMAESDYDPFGRPGAA